MKIRLFVQIFTLLTVCTVPSIATSFQLSPRGTVYEQSMRKEFSNWFDRVVLSITNKGIKHFAKAVHEEITHRTYGCNGIPEICGNPNVEFASPYVIAGVRWNDDPPFRLFYGEGRNTSCKTTETIRFTTQPRCWVQLFRDAQKKARRGVLLNATNHSSLLARSHFGDLQFLHSMASQDGELARETKRKILMWAKFTWAVALGNYPLGTKLAKIDIDGMQEFFGNSGWNIQDLFTVGNPAIRRHIKEVAFGSLLHMVQDSFAKGHVERAEAVTDTLCIGTTVEHIAPGSVKRFHSYVNQDVKKHAPQDNRSAFLHHWSNESPSVIDVGSTLVDYFERKSDWSIVGGYISCLFSLELPNTPASPGNGFAKSRTFLR